ncbi:MAG: 16S rRNA (guanine(966)-N(2))-methyltransferase RsmD [Actinomycetota bacterium]
MRVIAGSAKGRRLLAPPTNNTRPMTDRMREALFSSLGASVVDAAVLDLYAGSGSIGIEALSRGARMAVFVENAKPALDALHHNLAPFGGARVEVANRDVGAYLRTANITFDLIFCDPPWDLSSDSVDRLVAGCDRLAAAGCQLVVHRRATAPDPAPPAGWRHVTTRRYGDGKICKYQKENT